jgi:hypothetical protein
MREAADGGTVGDHNALATLLCTIPEEMQTRLAHQESTTEAWEAI